MNDSPVPAIEFVQVSKSFGTLGKPSWILAASQVTFSVARGEVVSIIGPPGCGKSTLLNLGSGLTKPNAGIVKVDGAVVSGPHSDVAFILQKDLLMPWRTISQNIEFGLELRGMRAAQRLDISQQIIKQFHLTGFGHYYPHQLSAGLHQRAVLARTLAVEPTVLLMDEPFSALDTQTKMILHQDLARTVSQKGKAVLFITDDLAEAVALSDRILVMSERPGTITAQIKIDIPDRHKPMERRKHPRVTQYVNYLMDFLQPDSKAKTPGRAAAPLPEDDSSARFWLEFNSRKPICA